MAVKYDYRKLRGRIKEKFNTIENFAEYIGISAVSLNNKLNNLVNFRQHEIEKAIAGLEITEQEVKAIFFTHEVEKNLTKNVEF